LEFGHNEAEGTHCCYHGWLFNVDGAILDTPRLCRLNWITGFDVLLIETRLWAEENGIGRILGARLSDAGLTREQLAAKLEVSDTTMGKLAGWAVLPWRPVRPLLALEFAGEDTGLSAAYRFNANTSVKVLFNLPGFSSADHLYIERQAFALQVGDCAGYLNVIRGGGTQMPLGYPVNKIDHVADVGVVIAARAGDDSVKVDGQAGGWVIGV
jgi:hypothetical protein